MPKCRSDYLFTRKAIRESIPLRSGIEAREIASVSGYSMVSVRRVIAELKAAGDVFIIDWKVDRDEEGFPTGQPRALYARGAKRKDAPRPAPIPKPLVSKHYRGRRDRKRIHLRLYGDVNGL